MKAKVVLVACALVLAVHELLLAVAATDRSLALLGALVVARLAAVVLVPPAVLAAAAVLVAQRLGSSSGAGISVGDDDGASIGVRGAK